MAVLERRVHVLFDPQEYEGLRRLAQAEGESVGSVIRESVRRRLDSDREGRRALAEQLIASARRQAQEPMTDWEEIKSGFERDHLTAIK